MSSKSAKRYVKEGTGHLSPTTRGDRYSYLRNGGPLMKHFGARRLDDITVGMLREWWGIEVSDAGRSVQTGRRYLETHRNSAG